MATERVALRGSNRLAVPSANQVGQPDPNTIIEATIVVRRKAELPPPDHHQISREEFAHLYGAAPADIEQVENFAAQFDLTVIEVDVARRMVRVSGTVANMSSAFGTQLRLYQSTQGQFRGRTGELSIPAHLDGVIEGVFGLDNRPQAHSRIRRAIVSPHAAGDTSYTPDKVAQLYNFPSEAEGKGETIAIIELGGGFKEADLKTYFTKLGIVPNPSVISVAVDGASNTPAGDPNSDDGEVLLDIEVIGSIATKAKIAVYFAPNTDQGFLDAITAAVHDRFRKPSVISISWGAAEAQWTAQSLKAYDDAFREAGLVGVTVCCASGDDGSTDNVPDGKAHVDFPASSPNVLACGGTRLESADGAITREVVWNQGPGRGASGGGVSETFPLPAYQAHAKIPPSVNNGHFQGRGVPDIAGDADPYTGYQILVDGRSGIFGGTSAVAPLWSALVALINEHRRKPLGFFNPHLYRHAQHALRDITNGNNGAYQAGPGWDACTGLGSPNGKELLSLFENHFHCD